MGCHKAAHLQCMAFFESEIIIRDCNRKEIFTSKRSVYTDFYVKKKQNKNIFVEPYKKITYD